MPGGNRGSVEEESARCPEGIAGEWSRSQRDARRESRESAVGVSEMPGENRWGC
jgi:hypothetical protein